MDSYRVILLVCTFLCFVATFALGSPKDYPPIPTPDTSSFGKGLSRTMHLLATSTPQHRNTVKILVYGQSITRGSYWLLLKAFLEKTFPHADLIMENLAIGGFSVPLLSLPAEQDVFPFYPDMILFQVYGGEPDYENLIRSFRMRLATEIAIQTDHVAVGQPTEWEDHHCFVWLPWLCNKYGLECLDIRHPWIEYLKRYNLTASELLADGVHPNQWGNWLMATIIQWYLRYDPSFPVDPFNLTTSYIVGKDAFFLNGKLTLRIDGNRIDLIALNPTKPGASSAKILIDGNPPSQFPECYTFTRPNFQTADTTTDWPWDIGSVVRVDHYSPLVAEDWTITFTDIDSTATNFSFRVDGSVTGFDGSGTSNQYFVSHSGRVLIKPNYWFIHQAYAGPYLVKFKPGFKITWKAELMGTDNYVLPSITDPAKEYITTVAQGLSNQFHNLEIIVDDPTKGDLPIYEIRVYRPSFEHE